MKQKVNHFDYAETICKALSKGVLLTTKLDGFVNTMTIGWGLLGVEWGKPIFMALVRESRHTRTMLDGNGEFTVNIPLEKADPEILKLCGTKSGRDMDKIKALGLTLEEGETISVPGLKELPLTLECKAIYRQNQELPGMPEGILSRYYPQNVEGTFPGSNRDPHIAYYGEILNAYIVTD